MDLLLLQASLAAFVAGFIDSIAGGGGLIQIPALFLLYPELPVPTLFGTNKLSSFSGTAVALYRYAKRIPIPWRVMAPAAACAFVGSFAGAWTVTRVASDALRPLVIVLLIAVAIYTFIRKDFGARATGMAANATLLGMLIGGGLGFYDGFFGPGTGSFLLFLFVGVIGLDFVAASASAKLVNVATNVAALLLFASTGHILLKVAIPMAICNVLGSLLGTRLVFMHGSRFVRGIFLVVVTVLIGKLLYDL